MKKIFILLINILFITEVKAEGLKYVNCGAFELPSGVANVINLVVNLLYLGVPIAIILSGSMDFAKATIAKDKKEIDSFRPKFINRLKSGTLVFLVFTIVKIFVSFVSSVTSSDINQCLECLVNHNSCGAEVESPHKLDIPEDQDYYIPEHSGPSLDDDAYEQDAANNSNISSGDTTTNSGSNNSSSNDSSSNDSSTSYSKTIFVGDSRTAGMCGNTGTTGCDTGTEGGYSLCGGKAIACSSKGYSWFDSTGINQINSKVSGGGYNIVLWWGVNDMHNLDKYYSKYISLADTTWKKNNLIVVTVGPIKAADRYTSQKAIDTFNSDLKNKFKTASKSNIKICDLASNVTLSNDDYSDNLHYNKAGYTKVYNYIKDKCL